MLQIWCFALRIRRMRVPGRAVMTGKLKDLLDARDWSLSRFVDYDMQVLILLFAIVAAWGGVRGTGFESSEFLAVMLAFAGLFVSIGWLIQRRHLSEMDRHNADALRSADPAANDPALDRLTVRAASPSLRSGQVFSVAVFALISALTVWAYEARETGYVAGMAQGGEPAQNEPVVVRVISEPQEVWLTVEHYPCANYWECAPEAGAGSFPLSQSLGYQNQFVAAPNAAAAYPTAPRRRAGSAPPVGVEPYGYN